MMFGRGFYNNTGCFGFGNFSSWYYLIAIGVVLIIAAIVIMARHRKSNNMNDPVLGILNDKFARGEISEEEYLYRKGVITGKRVVK